MPQEPHDPTPTGYRYLLATSVATNDRELVILGQPASPDEYDARGIPEDERHNCDAMGCGPLDHVILRVPLDATHAAMLKTIASRKEPA